MQETLQIDTPVIDMQDLEHQPGRGARVNNAGVKVRQRDEPHIADDPMFAREDEKAREAVAKFEESLKSLPPD